MSFLPKLLINPTFTHESVLLTDVTGTGTNGFGSPNPEVNDITSVEITISSELYVGNIIFFLTVVNGVITNATKTDYNGNVTNVLADLTSTVFPLEDFYLTAQLILSQQKFPDTCFDVIYKLNTSTDSYSFVFWFFTVFDTVSCFDKANIDYANGRANKEMVSEIDAMYFSFTSALYADRKEDAIKQQKQLLNSCANCGC